MRRVLGDMLMIAQSANTISQETARSYAHDIELLAKKGYLKSADITLLDGWNRELRAVRYEVDTAAGGLTMSRPGGVLWPRVPGTWLRVVLYYTAGYTSQAQVEMADKLENTWVPTSADTSHASLAASGGRDYASNGFGMRRKDFGT
jgi:hypothetical protein